MESNSQNLETMGKSFYEFLASAGNLVPLLFALLSLVICFKTLINIWRLTSREEMTSVDPEQSLFHQWVAFGFGGLLGISAVVTYALSSMWG